MAASAYTITADANHVWHAHWNSKTYPLGHDRKRAEEVMQALAAAARPTVLVSGRDLVACLHRHSAEAPCEYITLIENAVG